MEKLEANYISSVSQKGNLKDKIFVSTPKSTRQLCELKISFAPLRELTVHVLAKAQRKTEGRKEIFKSSLNRLGKAERVRIVL
jgi:hypothetical protein